MTESEGESGIDFKEGGKENPPKSSFSFSTTKDILNRVLGEGRWVPEICTSNESSSASFHALQSDSHLCFI